MPIGDSGKFITTAADLFREIKRRGLELRRGNGRDDALYLRLAAALGIPGKRLQSHLDAGRISIERFVGAFFSLLNPFAKMYSDIYAAMQYFGAKHSQESVLLQFDFQANPDDPLKFDLNQFREIRESMRRVTGKFRVNQWKYDDLSRLFEFYRRLNNDVLYEPFSDYYKPGQPFQLEEGPRESGPLGDVFRIIRVAFQAIIDEAANPPTRATEPIVALDHLENRDSRRNLDDKPDLRRLASLLTDLIPGYRILVRQLRHGPVLRAIDANVIKEAVDFFKKEIEARVETSEEFGEALVREFLELLNLPFWRHRWFLYEIWCTFTVIMGLRDYNVRLNLDSGGLRISEGRESCIAEFLCAEGGKVEIWAQRQTPLSGVRGRRGIQPDLRLCLSGVDPILGTIVIVEFKQRKVMKPGETACLLDLYEKGTPESLQNYYLNYDAVPLIPPDQALMNSKSRLIGHFHPGQTETVASFQRELIQALIRGGHRPCKLLFDVLLLDVSSSMTKALRNPQVRTNLERLLNLNPGIRVYFFDTRLIVPGEGNVVSRVDSYLTGGTQLEVALGDLAVREPQAASLLIVTDGGYGDAPTLSQFRVQECKPEDIKQLEASLLS